MAGERLAKAIKDEAKKQTNTSESTDLLYGEVLSLSPLQVKVDSRYTIDESMIELSALCVEKTVELSIDIGGITYKKDNTLWRGLQIGDKVKILRVHRGQLFYIIEREGGLTI